MVRLRQLHGFTLIELMIVVAIIGILAAIALPGFQKAACRAKASEARTVLRQIATAEFAYHTEHDEYVFFPGPGFPSELGVEVDGFTRYVYSVDADPSGFLAIAVGAPGGMQGDEWHLDGNNALIWFAPHTDCQ